MFTVRFLQYVNERGSGTRGRGLGGGARGTVWTSRGLMDVLALGLGPSELALSNPNAVSCVKGEIHNVLSIMRLNRRWASVERFKKEIPLQVSQLLPKSSSFSYVRTPGSVRHLLRNCYCIRYIQSESYLIRSFKTLHAYLESVDDLSDVDTPKYFEPFLDVIRSEHTSGPITGVALSSINKFLLYGFLSTESPRVREAINNIASSVAGCKFEATDVESDEVRA